MLLDPGSGCASPLSIDGIALGVVTWSTSRFSTVQVGQMVLDRYIWDTTVHAEVFEDARLMCEPALTVDSGVSLAV